MTTNKSGDGKTSPFGNGSGAVASAAGKPTDFTRTATSNVGGAHDFVRDPKGTVTGPKPTDFTKGVPGSQPEGPDPSINPQSVPAGGKLPFSGPSQPTSKPFKL